MPFCLSLWWAIPSPTRITSLPHPQVLTLLIYFASGHYRHDSSFESIRDYSLPARSLRSSSEQRTFEVIIFEGVLTLRGIFMIRNVFLIPGMRKLRSRLKTAIRHCLQGKSSITLTVIPQNTVGASDVLFLVLMLFAAAFIFAVLGTKVARFLPLPLELFHSVLVV